MACDKSGGMELPRGVSSGGGMATAADILDGAVSNVLSREVSRDSMNEGQVCKYADKSCDDIGIAIIRLAGSTPIAFATPSTRGPKQRRNLHFG